MTTKWIKHKASDFADYTLKPKFLPDGVESVVLGFEATRRPRRGAYVQPMYSVYIRGHARGGFVGGSAGRALRHNGRKIFTLRTAKQRGWKYGTWPYWMAKHGIVCDSCYGTGLCPNCEGDGKDGNGFDCDDCDDSTGECQNCKNRKTARS